MVRMPVTRLRELRALRTSRKTKPKEIEEDDKIFFKKILKVNINAKYKGAKNGIS